MNLKDQIEKEFSFVVRDNVRYIRESNILRGIDEAVEQIEREIQGLIDLLAQNPIDVVAIKAWQIRFSKKLVEILKGEHK